MWLAWFLYATLMRLAPIAGRAAQGAPSWRTHAVALQQAMSARPGTAIGTGAVTSTMARPLGSATSDECQIDSIAQAWAVISGAGGRGRAVRAIAAVKFN